MKTTAYAAINTDEAIRMKSSSGGVFTLLAKDVLSRGGVVFGAAVTEQLQVIHIAVESPEELHRLRGSKYVRSHLGDSYQQAEAYLRAGRPVLFTGTPCQIAGLRAYLKQTYDNLLCQDLVCHGAPMPSVWQQYVCYREQQAGAKAVEVNFRDKSTGWESYGVQMTFQNGKVYRSIYWDDPYMQAFLKDLSLGNSCYRCAFKGMQRQADLTLADFWGVKNIQNDMYDGNGTSAVLVHTQKGGEALQRVQGRLKLQPADGDAVAACNPAMLHAAAEPAARKAFLEELCPENFAAVVKKYCPREPLAKRLVDKIKRAVKKLLKK